MTERRPFAEASRELLRSSVLEVVDDMVRERPWSSVSMAAVADAVGVSRQTLYNVFGTRDELARAYVLWAAQDLLDDIERAVAANRGDLQAALIVSFELFLSIAPSHPLVRALVSTSGAEDLVALVSTPAGQPLIAAAVARLRSIIAAHSPKVDGQLLDDLADLLVRMAISHLTVPTRTPGAAAAGLANVLGPLLAGVAADAPA